MTRVEDRKSVPNQPHSQRLMTASRAIWKAALSTSQPASITGCGQIGIGALGTAKLTL